MQIHARKHIAPAPRTGLSISSSLQFITMKWVLVPLLFALCYDIARSSHSHDDAVDVDEEATPDSVRLNKHEKLIILSFDGFRHDYADKVPTPNLKRLQENGVSTKYMHPVFPTKTFVNHQSFVTGLYAASHGIVDNRFYDPKYGELLEGFLPYNDRLWNYKDNVVPIWILNEWAGDGRISGVSFPGANQPYGANKTLPHHYLTYNESLSFEDRVDIVLSWLTHAEYPANLIFMYFNEPDTAGHKFGPESEEVKRAIVRMDSVTKYLIDKLTSAGLFDHVNLMVWSDHGMQEVSLQNRINLTALVNMPGAYKQVGNSPVLQIQPSEGNEVTVYDALKLASVDRPFSVYRRSEIPERWHYSECRRIMDILVVADPGFVFDDFKSAKRYDDTTQQFGVHGYDNDVLNMRPFFLAHGPRFKRNYEAEPFMNIDLFPLIAHLMGFDPAPNNGSLRKVVAMLSSGRKSASNPSACVGFLLLHVCIISGRWIFA